tara:strand:+ start:318 stop:623 length:306 start_codon:yes stop_codon:yes gene_type:complete
MEKIIRTLEEMQNKTERDFIDSELKQKENTGSVCINTNAYLENINEIKKAIDTLKTKKYTEEELDVILTKQREICCEAMEKWCEVNDLNKSGHIVLYAPRP